MSIGADRSARFRIGSDTAAEEQDSVVVERSRSSAPTTTSHSQVWLASRHASQSVLVLGVFATAELARLHCDRFERYVDGVSEWLPPRSGRQYWSSSDREYEFRVEQWPVRESVHSPLPVTTADWIRPDRRNAVDRLIAQAHRDRGDSEIETLLRERAGR